MLQFEGVLLTSPKTVILLHDRFLLLLNPVI
jgi:hypothetical protein